MTDLEFTASVTARLDQLGIPYMLTGSMAMSVYASPRSTRDVDIVVAMNEQDIPNLLNAFSPDCYLDEDSAREAIKQRGMFNIIHYESVMKADLIVRKDTDFNRQEFERRSTVNFRGVPLSVVSAEDLILFKLFWSKDSDSNLQMEDVKRLVRSVSDLDWNYMEVSSKVLGVTDLMRKVRDDA